MTPPNILFLFTDQQRWDTIAAGGNPVIRTPVLDELCARGVRFDRAYTPSPVCVPARCSAMTGRLPHCTGCFENGSPMPDPAEVPTMMHVLRDAGYQTHATGKMHFVPAGRDYGFESMELSDRAAGENTYHAFVRRRGYEAVFNPGGMTGDMYYIPQVSPVPQDVHHTAWTAERSIEFLRRRDRSRPFFLWTSFIKPHPPFTPPYPWHTLYRSTDVPLPKRPPQYQALQTWLMRHQNRYKWRESGPDDNLLRTMKAYYYAEISFVDHHVGRILEALRESGELENTLIVYSSDHGELMGDYHSFGKRTFLDSAARVPMLAVWPGRLPENEVCRAPVSLIDVMPTFLEAAGIDVTPFQLDGQSLRAVYEQRTADRVVLGQILEAANAAYMATDGRWKYFYSAPDEREYLFDLEADPDETEDVATITVHGPGIVGRREVSPAAAARDAERTAARDRLRGVLVERFRRDGYLAPLAGGDWRRYGRGADPANADDDRFGHGPAWGDPYVRIPGYAQPWFPPRR
ncbi:MAG: sulfatase-like hydrolase/transferase [Chloroflexi bacterium]|nr:sulfatase-like hydrolase/transferase [Chloroflexota bacterium]